MSRKERLPLPDGMSQEFFEKKFQKAESVGDIVSNLLEFERDRTHSTLYIGDEKYDLEDIVAVIDNLDMITAASVLLFMNIHSCMKAVLTPNDKVRATKMGMIYDTAIDFGIRGARGILTIRDEIYSELGYVPE